MCSIMIFMTCVNTSWAVERPKLRHKLAHLSLEIESSELLVGYPDWYMEIYVGELD